MTSRDQKWISRYQLILPPINVAANLAEEDHRMKTPEDVLEMLAAIRDEGHDLVNEDTMTLLEIGFNLGYERESVWFLYNADGAGDYDKPLLDVAKYTQAIVDLNSPPVLKLGKKTVTYDIETGETDV